MAAELDSLPQDILSEHLLPKLDFTALMALRRVSSGLRQQVSNPRNLDLFVQKTAASRYACPDLAAPADLTDLLQRCRTRHEIIQDLEKATQAHLLVPHFKATWATDLHVKDLWVARASGMWNVCLQTAQQKLLNFGAPHLRSPFQLRSSLPYVSVVCANYDIVCSPNGRYHFKLMPDYLVIDCGPGRRKVYGIADPQSLSLQWSPCSRSLAIGLGGRQRILRMGDLSSEVIPGKSCQWAADGNRLLSVEPLAVRLYDLGSRETTVYPSMRHAAYSSLDDSLFLATASGDLYRGHAAEDSEFVAQGDGPLLDLKMGPPRPEARLALRSCTSLRLLNPASGEETFSAQLPATSGSLKWSPQGNHLALVTWSTAPSYASAPSPETTVRFFDAKLQQLGASVSIRRGRNTFMPSSVVFSPSERYAAVVQGGDVTLVRCSPAKVLAHYANLQRRKTPLRWSADETRLVTSAGVVCLTRSLATLPLHKRSSCVSLGDTLHTAWGLNTFLPSAAIFLSGIFLTAPRPILYCAAATAAIVAAATGMPLAQALAEGPGVEKKIIFNTLKQ
jgi:WD40 repeat protein